jgi:heme exporter protein B
MKRFIAHTCAIFIKDLKHELRTRETFLSTFIFGVLVLTLFNFSFQNISSNAAELTPGILWVTFTFAGILGLNRTLAIEKENSGLETLLASAVSPSSIFLGKMLTNFFFMILSQICLMPCFIVLFNIPIGVYFYKLFLINLIATLGFASVGTLFSTIAMHTRMRDVFLPLLLCPVIIPVLIGSVECYREILFHEWAWNSAWFKLLIGYDVIFFSVSIMIFDYVLED